MLAVLLSFVLTACNNDTEEKPNVDKKTTTTANVKKDDSKDKTEKSNPKSEEQEKSKDEAKKKKDDSSTPKAKTNQQTKHVTKKKISTTESINVKQLTNQAMSNYLSVMPNAFSQRNYNAVKPYIRSGSKAEEYILSKLPTGNFDNYRIVSQSIDRIDVRDKYAHVIVTRVMSSQATGNQLKRVITVFDFYYNKQTRKMELYDFNDKAIFDAESNTARSETPKVTPAKPQQAKGDASTCVQTRLQMSCEGVSDKQLLSTYNAMVKAGTLPKAAYNGCVSCTIKDAYQLKDKSAVSQVKVKNLPQAVQMASDKYRSKVEAYYSEMDIAIVGAEPINGTDIQEDSGGKYYKVKAIDIDTKELLQTYKVYIATGVIVAE
ncbi:TcaA NTF2-like domain-containing protein [Macrococcus animalis]|uniref:TcaA NTF2-like domain-containing protein n=1 Tax=Macrococcus animalis TaxID=3395467 RepID=UPI0039BDE1E0